MDCAPVFPPSSPPPAPRPSNLTTPTTFSPATTNHTGSTVQDSEVDTPAENGLELIREESRPASPGKPDPDDDETVFCDWIDALANKVAAETNHRQQE